jgi:hypothetical protein
MNFVSSSIRAGCYVNLGCRSSPRLIFEIDIRQLLAGGVFHDEAGGRFLDGPGRREAVLFFGQFD